MMGPRAGTGLATRQSIVILLYREPVTEIGVTEAPASNAVVPGLVATSDIVGGQLLHCFERVEATAIDRYKHKHQTNAPCLKESTFYFLNKSVRNQPI